MSDGKNDLEAVTDSAKLDQLLGLVATMNTWLDHQSQRLASVEAAIPLLAQACGVPLLTGSAGGSSGAVVGSGVVAGTCMTSLGAGDVDDPSDGPCSGGGFAAHGGGCREHGGGICNGRFGRDRGDDAGACRSTITFPSFIGESDTLPWLNKCSIYFHGMGTSADEKV
jgi:hypothetical protein